MTIQLPREIQPALFGLPAKSPAFTGRDDDLGEILHSIDPTRSDDSKSAIHLISGLGGVGKTELVNQIAHTVRDRSDWFPGGVVFIDIFGYDKGHSLSPDRALASLLSSLGVAEENVPVDLQSKVRLYRSVLAAYAESGRRILVIIDNASSADQVSSLLPTDSSSVTLVTSRHTLSIGARLHELQALTSSSSVDLLRKSVTIARGEADLRIDEDVSSSYTLAWLCGNLPLALQIAASILADSPRRPVSSLVESLKAAHNRIDELQRDQKAVRAVFDLSYELLTEEEKRVLGFVSFSPGVDISTQAAARLIDVPENRVERTLLALSRAHLVEQGSIWGRWRLHDLVRLYALEAVADISGQEDAVVRLFDFYLEHTREAAELLGGKEASLIFSSRDLAFEWLDAECRNLIETVHIAAKQPGLYSYAAEIPHRLARYLDARRLFNDWKELMEVSLSILEETGHLHHLANALDSLGMACRELHQLPSSISFHRLAVNMARDLGDDDVLARYLNNMGVSLCDVRDFEGALNAHLEAADLFRAQQEFQGFARASDNAACALRQLGRLEEAFALHEKSVQVFRNAGARDSEARTMSHMGCTLMDLGRLDDAVEAHKRSVELFIDLSLKGIAAHALINLSNALRARGDLVDSLSSLDEALSILEELPDAVGRGRALNQRGLIYTDLEEFDRAVVEFKESLRILSDFDGLIDRGYAFANLGRLYGIRNQPVEAVDSFKQASAVFRQCNALDDMRIVDGLIKLMSLGIPEN
ncbi:ATP-binding protein [Streptomyces aquilus]|uniref:ATP-binding protein n=1 Tax=Streptomyces aquilus TaxID=2548456 RepID=UPI0037D2F734